MSVNNEKVLPLVGNEGGLGDTKLSSFPIPTVDDKVIIFDKFDMDFERPLVILDGVTDVKIKEELNGAYELTMSASHKVNNRNLAVGNYIQVAGDIFKIIKASHSRKANELLINLDCEHIYFELLDDYIDKAEDKSFFPHELADYIKQFTNFDIEVDQDVIDNKEDFPKRRMRISRGSPIKTINRMLKTWDLEIHRFRRSIAIKDGLNKDKIQLFKHQKNISSLERVDQGGKLTTRLFLLGNEGLSIEGLELINIPYINTTKDGITTFFTDNEVVICTVLSKDGKIISNYIDSKYLESYPTPKNGEIVDGYIKDKLELFEKGIRELSEIESITNSYTINAIELKKYSGDIEKFGLGYTAIIQDEDLLHDTEYNLVESRIIEYEYYPFDSNKDSVIKLGYKNEGSLEFFKSLDEVKDIVEENVDKWDDIADIVEDLGTDKFTLNWTTNKSNIEINSRETEIANLTVGMGENSDGQGQLLINMLANKESTFIIRVYDNETQELFSPVIREVNKGYNSITIPHGYYKKTEGSHRFSITAQSISGTTYVQPKGLSYNINAIGRAVSEIESVAEDISIRSYLDEDEEIYIISKGELNNPVISKGKYIENHIYSNSDIETVWNMKDITEVHNLLIEFDGHFRLPFGKNQYRLVTQKKPWIFWINVDKELWGQYGDDVSTGRLLGNSVNQASVVKGWSLEGVSRDLGLILAYVKIDGSVNYRQLTGLGSLNSTTQAKWSTEAVLTGAGLENKEVHVSRLNDYRVAFSVNGVNKIFISDRLYVGQASPVEYVNLDISLDDQMTFITVYPKVDIPYDMTVYWSTNDYKKFTLSANYNWQIRKDGCDLFANIDNNSDGVIESVKVNPNNSHELIITMDKVVNRGSLKLTPDPKCLIGLHDNGTRMKLVDELIVFEVRYNTSETVELNLELVSLGIDVFQRKDIDVELEDEFIELNMQVSESSIDIFRLGKIKTSNKEHISINMEISAVGIDILKGGSIIT